MCFDEKTSWFTLAIGTLFNLYGVLYYQDIRYLGVAILWQWVLLMQLFDAIAWKYPDCSNGKNIWATRMAMIANYTQPIVVYLVLMLLANKVPKRDKIISTIFIFAYICSVIYSTQETDITCLERTESCSNLQYYWWDNKKVTLVLYMICMLVIPILLFIPKSFGYYTTAFIFISLLISNKVYTCGTASVWCWLAAFAPIMNFFMWKYLVEEKWCIF